MLNTQGFPPDPVKWDREIDIPRTDVENEALRVIRLLSTTCKPIEKEKTGKPFDFPALVDQTLRISNLRFLEGLLLIQQFLDSIE